MTRTVPKWIGATDDTPIPLRVKLRILDRQNNRCACGCGVKLGQAGEGIEYDHRIAIINGGANAESNVDALRPPCHKAKTARDVAEKATVARKRAKALGLAKSRNPLPGGRGSAWKRTFGQGWVKRAK